MEKHGKIQKPAVSMKKNTLPPDLDILCRKLCQQVLNVSEYQNLSGSEVNQVSSFLIRFNQEFSSSRESLNKSLQNWFLGKNSPSPAKVNQIAQSLGYDSYHEFTLQHRKKIKVAQLQRSIRLNPFQKTLLYCALALFAVAMLPGLIPLSEKLIETPDVQSALLASVIQAIVVVLFFVVTHFSDFGGRDQIFAKNNYPPEVNKSLVQFFNGWEMLWLSFSVLYIWFCLLYGLGIPISPYTQAVSDIITIFSSICFAYLFSVMDVQSIPRSPGSNSIRVFYNYLIIFTIGLTISSMLSVIDRYYHLGALNGMGTYVLGYANVIVMLYFFGRLESHYLNVNRFVLLPLYTYAIIQIAYVLFFEANTGKASYAAYIIGMALILKGFLYFLIREWIKDGKLAQYFLKQHEKIKE